MQAKFLLKKLDFFVKRCIQELLLLQFLDYYVMDSDGGASVFFENITKNIKKYYYAEK